jgi:hypothetical protein
VPQPITVRYEAARKQLLNGDFSVAQEALAELGQQPVPEPLRSWIIVHEAMAAFLGGRPEPARSAFKKLTSGEAPAAKAGEKQLAAFFAELGAQAANTEATPPDAAKKFDTRTFGAIAPFVFALKDWELGKFSEANQLFASFLASEPQGTSAWIADYRPLAEKYTGSFSAYEAANSGLKKAKTAEERAKVLASLDALKKAPGKMAEVGGALQRDTQKRFAELDEAEQKKAGETREKEAKQLADAKAKYNALCNVYRFDETAALFARLTLTESALAAERDALSKKAKWLTQFKGQLIVDINARGYPEPISKRTGVAMPGGVKKASAAQCEIQTPYGWIPVPWADLPPAMLFKMAEYFTKNETAPERVADRKWLAGVFAFGFGMTREGRGLLADAAQTKDEYREQLSMFIDSSQ